MKKLLSSLSFVGLAVILLTSGCGGSTFTPIAEVTITPMETDGSATAETPDGSATAETPDGSATPAGASATPAGVSTNTPSSGGVATNTASAVAITSTPGIPVTGLQVDHVGQFCIDTIAHEVLLMPEAATIEIVPATTGGASNPNDVICETVESLNDTQVVICRGPAQANFALNVCMDGTSCAVDSFKLRQCPAQGPGGGGGATPPPTTSTPTSATGTTPTATP
jgi:hypothetical protein